MHLCIFAAHFLFVYAKPVSLGNFIVSKGKVVSETVNSRKCVMIQAACLGVMQLPCNKHLQEKTQVIDNMERLLKCKC